MGDRRKGDQVDVSDAGGLDIADAYREVHCAVCGEDAQETDQHDYLGEDRPDD
jgi:hypothetical protein